MKVDVRREPGSRAVLEVEIPVDVVAQGVEAALRRLNQRVEIPGFRRGKAPRTLLERYVGRDTVLEEAVKTLVPDAYARAVDQVGVTPITRPEIKVETLEEGKPLRFVATVDLMPEVRLGDYRRLRLPFTPPQVTDEDVDAAIADLRARHGHLVSAPGAAAARGDFILVRVTELSGPVERFARGKEYLIEIGGGAYPAEAEEALVGAAAGETRTIRVGEQTVTVEVLDVKRRELPEVTDAFARSAGGVASVAALRESLRTRLEREAAERARTEYEQRILEALLASAEIDLPESMVEHEVEHMVADLAETLQRRGLTLQRYYAATGKTEDGLRQEFRPAAERRLRLQLAVEEVARAEGLSPTQEEIDREVENVARGLQQDPARVREWLVQTGRYDSLTGALRRRKALEYLVGLARGE
ncbi:MAG: trigger factor [Armatimonadota bacterium]|nr:trigger factor [Armatimonadota bacterium]MDR7451956.1 trigger factor [Armatimonadota bacterium]MDR7466638.1 trigger factor [Armatimonadota bacterium]MDR7492888.1 trigger factor [Armatimonadota bacterium]MDR7498664.1 trigger factor [Armatimonadota bacterium]